MKWLGRHISRLLGRSLTRAFTILLPACIRDSAVAWFKDLTDLEEGYVQDEIGDRTDDVFYGQYLAESSVTGLLDFDGIGDYVSFGDTADIIRNSKAVAFEMNLEENASTDYFSVLAFKSTSAGDFLSVAYSPGLGMFRTRSSTFAGGGRDYDISAYRNQLIEVVITKVSASVIQLTVNGVAITPIGDTSGTEPTFSYIGYGDGIYEYANYFTIWNVRIYDGTITNSWLGNPDGNTDAAWVDDTGSYDGTVFGTPGVTETPYYINFYRTSGTFDYTDPSDGSLVEDVSIPATGLYTIPANGICEIVTSDGSEYPICERAGNVLHDISENSIHISVNNPSWSETLYGSDYLNQEGFVDKVDFDTAGYTWETEVDGTPIALNDNTLIPLGQWTFDFLTDSQGSPLIDSEGSPLYLKTSL